MAAALFNFSSYCINEEQTLFFSSFCFELGFGFLRWLAAILLKLDLDVRWTNRTIFHSASLRGYDISRRLLLFLSLHINILCENFTLLKLY